MSSNDALRLVNDDPTGQNHTIENLRMYITIALTYKSEENLQNLFFMAYLAKFRNDHDVISCKQLHGKQTELAECLSVTENVYQKELSRLQSEIWLDKTKYFKAGWKKLLDPAKSVLTLSPKDHARVKFYIDALDLKNNRDSRGFYRLMATRIPYVLLFCTIDLDKLGEILNSLSRQELLMVSSFVDAVTLRKDMLSPLKLSSVLKTRILQRIAWIKDVLSPNQKTIRDALRRMQTMAEKFPYALGAVTALKLIMQEQYQEALPMKGGAKIQWRSIGILIVLFFSFIFGLMFAIITLPLFIIKDTAQYLVRRKLHGADLNTYNQDGLNLVYMSMVDRLAKTMKWLPSKLLPPTKHDTVAFEVALKLDQPFIE